MKRKILTIVFCAVLLVSVLSLSSFALTPDEYGSNYDTSHENNHCCEDTNGIHYNQGYEDGLLDGKPTQEEIDSYKQEAVDSYLNDDAYLGGLADVYNQAYKDGENAKQQEMQTQLNSRYQDGINAGYEAGYQGAYDEAEEKVYNKGVADGKAEFRAGTEYAVTLQEYLDKGYEMGYTEGHNDGYENGMENSIEPSALFALLFSIIGLVIVLLTLTYAKEKKNRKGR